MRLFVALEIPEETRETLRELMRRLQRKFKAARWVRPESMHLTLKFIGHVEVEKLPPIRRVLAGVRNAHPIDVEFRGMGFFPSPRRPRVLWVGVEATPNLAQLVSKMDAELAELGIPSEKRAFSPHLTLARFNPDEVRERGKPLPGLAQVVKEAETAKDKSFGSLRASEFHLFESKLKPSGAEYTRIETFPFVEPSS